MSFPRPHPVANTPTLQPTLRTYEYYTQKPGERFTVWPDPPWLASPKQVAASYIQFGNTHVLWWRTEADGTDTLVLAEHKDFVYSIREIDSKPPAQ